MDGMTAWHKAAEDGWYDSWHAKLTTTLPFAFSRSVASRHSAEKRNPEDRWQVVIPLKSGIQKTAWRHTLYRIGTRNPGEKTKVAYNVAVFWIPRRSAELKVAVKAMTT